MTAWTDGRRNYTRDDIVDILFDDQTCSEIFEEEFNENYTPIEIVNRYAGSEGYNSEFYDWLDAMEDAELSDLLVRTGAGHIEPVRTSASRKPRSKSAQKSGSNSCKPKSAKGSTKKGSRAGSPKRKPARRR